MERDLVTHLPLQYRRVFGAPGPRYRPEYVCSHPFCDARRDLELHHLWPRSFLRNQPRDWVKLPDGKVIGNLVWLCAPHHILISENKTRIFFGHRHFYWHGGDDAVEPLDPQPPLSQSDIPDDDSPRETPRSALGGLTGRSRAWSDSCGYCKGYPDQSPSPDCLSAEYHPVEKTSSEIWEPISPGENCPACKRRVPHPKKESSPKTTVTKSWRLPAEEKEAREELLEQTASHLGISTSSKFWLDRTILELCVLALQGPGK